jgi:hypothetical protein
VNYPRKKSASQGSNNFGGSNNQQRNKSRFSHGHGGGGNQGHNNNRPRKNYGAMREKYLAQARDALASGDRVLAENYFQHADHCFRMIAEDNANRPPRVHAPQEQQQVAEAAPEAVVEEDDSISTNVSSLPAFLTANYEAPKKEGEPVIVQNWEEE